MADTTKTMEVQALWDGTKLKAGTEEAEAAVEELARSVETASDSMRRSLDSIDDGVSSTLGSGGTFSRSVDDVETEGGRLTEVGTEVGAEFSSNLAEGISSGDASATLTDSVTGLFATLGALGPTAAVAGVGGLLATGVVKGIIDGMAARRQAVVDSVNEVLSGVLNSTDKFAEAIRDELIGAFSLESRLTNLGGGDLSKGIAIAEQTAKDLGYELDTVYDALEGEISPATNRFREALVKAQDEGTLLKGTFYNSSLLMDETAENADAVYKAISDTRGGLELAKQQAEGLVEHMRQNKILAEGTRDANTSNAEALERAEAAISRINTRNPNGWALQ